MIGMGFRRTVEYHWSDLQAFRGIVEEGAGLTKYMKR